MSFSWRRSDAGKTGKPSGSGRPLFAVAALHVEILEDRLAPSATSLMHPLLPKPTQTTGTIAGVVKPRGFTFNGLGPIQTGPAILASAGQIAALKNVPLVPASARPIDPGGGGLHDLAFLQQQQTAGSIIHTSFWQAGESAAPTADDAWLNELLRAKQSLVPPAPNPAPETEPAATPSDPGAPKSGPYEDSTSDAAECASGSTEERFSPPARAQIVCRLVMQARPGCLIAVVLLLSWTSCDYDQRRRGRAAGKPTANRWLPGRWHPGKYPELRPRPARAPPAWEQDFKGRPRGLLFFCAYRRYLSMPKSRIVKIGR